MSRFSRFTLSLLSGYGVLAAQMVFTLLSLPLALRYLSTAEFGLWALTMQIAGFIALVDFGMSGALARILIEYKDAPQGGEYGGVILTGLLVNALQGVLVLLVGAGLAWSIARLVGVPAEAESTFRSLLIWQSVSLATSFLHRIVWHVLIAHQRQEVVNFTLIAHVLVNLIALWLCFRARMGVFSMVWAQLAAQVFLGVLAFALAVRLKLFSGLRWNSPSWRRFNELFAFSRDMFLYSVGGQLVAASQTILVTRMVGLEAGAIWYFCTRALSLVSQAVYKIVDYSFPALAEMIVRRETERLKVRFRALVASATSVTVAAAAMLFVCNQPFVALLSGGKIAWPSINDLLLGCGLVMSLLVRGHTGLIGLTRDFRFLRYVYLLEGLFFVATALVALRVGGITEMIVASIVASLLFSFSYGIRRNTRYFGVTAREILVGWLQPSVRLALFLGPIALAVWWSTQQFDAAWRLAINGVVVGAAATTLLWRCGLEPSVREELQNRVLSRSFGVATQRS
jgi:O-antigen/teichoic acid export membrane protein